MYLDYGEYKVFGGNLSNADFIRFAFRAKKEIDNATFKRITEVTDDIKHCMFELIEYISANMQNGTVSGVTSVSNDGYSVTYAGGKNGDDNIYDIISTYLPAELLYRGVE